MDLEDLGNPPVHHTTRSATNELPRIVPTKKALYGDRQAQAESQVAPVHQQASVVYNPVHFGQSVQKSQSQHFAASQPLNQSFMTATHSAVAAPSLPNAPPLFIGFLTNDVSMDQIKNLFTS